MIDDDDKIDVNDDIICPYKGENIETKTNFENNVIYWDDWVEWDSISKESREAKKIFGRTSWKMNYREEVISPIHLAVENEDIDILKLLMNQPEIDVNKKLIRYYNPTEDRLPSVCFTDIKKEIKTAIHIAIEKRNLEIVKLLCTNSQIDINVKTMDCYPYENDTRERKTPIHIAIENNDVEIVEFLANLPNIKINSKSIYERWCCEKVEYEEKTPLNFAAETGNIKIFEILLSHPKIKINKELIEFYVYEGIHKRKDTSLIIAIENQHYNIVKLLLDSHKTDKYCLSIKEFRDSNYIRKKKFKTPLYLAVANNDVKMVELLLSCTNIDINNGLMEIGGGTYLDCKEPSIDIYDPYTRMDYNKPIKPKNQKRLDYLIYKKDKKNYQRYEKMIEEEDTDDDFDFEYRIYNIKTAKEIAETIGNDEICQLLDKAFSEQNKYKYVEVIEVGDEVEEEEENEKKR